jgi:hypothetical protein
MTYTKFWDNCRPAAFCPFPDRRSIFKTDHTIFEICQQLQPSPCHNPQMAEHILRRIAPEHLNAYMRHEVTALFISESYGITRNYLWREVKRGKPPRQRSKKDLRKARLEWRLSLFNNGKPQSMKALAEIANCTERTMYRVYALYRKRNAATSQQPV